MNVVAGRPGPFMTAEEFLAWPEDGTGFTYQLVDGEVCCLSPASRTHGVIQGNIVRLNGNAIIAADLPLQVGVEIATQPRVNASTNVRVPDVLVAGLTDVEGEIVAAEPLLVVEVLSPGNTDYTRDNVRSYATQPSVREIVVVHSMRRRVEVHRRLQDGTWAADPEIVEDGARLRLASVALDVAVGEVYARSWFDR